MRQPESNRATVLPGIAGLMLTLGAAPRSDIRNLRGLAAVVLRGRLIEAEELARLRGADQEP